MQIKHNIIAGTQTNFKKQTFRAVLRLLGWKGKARQIVQATSRN